MNRHRFLLSFGIGMACYVFALTTSVAVLATTTLEAGWRTIVALLPMVPAAGVAISVMRQVRSMDELQRRIQLEALALAFGGTALATFSYGFLETVGYPKLSMFFVWPLMALLWMIGSLISGRRYR